eukprot:1390031-Pyramimonas_sp.AAC.1
MLKKGAKPQLIARKRSAFVAGKSGVQPRQISQAWVTSLATCIARSSSTSTAISTALYEGCCNLDSQLSATWRKKGGAAVIWGLPGYDLSKQFVVNKLEGRIRSNLASGKSARIHAAFSCQPWTSLQRLVVKIDPSKTPQLKKARAKSKLMIGLLLQA